MIEGWYRSLWEENVFGGIVRKCSIVEYVSMVEIFRGGLGWIFYFWGGLGLV